jgi:hypothetical protein
MTKHGRRLRTWAVAVQLMLGGAVGACSTAEETSSGSDAGEPPADPGDPSDGGDQGVEDAEDDPDTDGGASEPDGSPLEGGGSSPDTGLPGAEAPVITGNVEARDQACDSDNRVCVAAGETTGIVGVSVTPIVLDGVAVAEGVVISGPSYVLTTEDDGSLTLILKAPSVDDPALTVQVIYSAGEGAPWQTVSSTTANGFISIPEAAGGTYAVVTTAPATVYREDFEKGAQPAWRWQVADQSVQQGQFAARPPMLEAGGESPFTVNCGGLEHTSLAFYYRNYYASLDLLVDGELYEELPNTGGGYVERTIVVPAGAHTYQWRANASTAGVPALGLDDIRCVRTPVLRNGTATWTFDQGFTPIELTGFSSKSDGWEISNGGQAGGFEARPAIADAGGRVSLESDCGGLEHSELTFYYRNYYAMIALYVDDALYEELPNTGGGFAQRTVVVPSGSHTYRWEARVDTAGRANVGLDSIACRNKPTRTNRNRTWGFDEGFVPSEFEGFSSVSDGWEISNGGQAGGLEARPAVLDAGGSAALSTTCDGFAHSALSFHYRNYYGTLELHVDGRLYESLANTGGGYASRTIVLPSGTHTYRWVARTDTAGRPNVGLDTVVCQAFPAPSAQSLRWGFDERAIPAEFTGFTADAPGWEITDGGQSGGFEARPAIITDTSKGLALETRCAGASHDRLEFSYRNYYSTLELFVDGALYESLPNTGGGYASRTIVVPAGTHTYRWVAKTSTPGRPNVAVDTVACRAP